MTTDEFRTLTARTGLPVAKLAETLGVHRTTVYKYLWGTRRTIPSEVADKLREIAQEKEHQP